LPAEFVDNSFSGWNGRARIEWPNRGYAVAIEADPAIRLTHFYSLGADCPIFCFEQITHQIDAFNLPASRMRPACAYSPPARKRRCGSATPPNGSELMCG
jgi:galactose mutarotase-like enzyme